MSANEARATDSAGTWLTGRQSERASGQNVHTIMKNALLGRIRYRAEPGESLRFWSSDVAKLAGGR